MVTTYQPKSTERAPKTFRLIVDGQQMNVIVEALRQFEQKHPGALENAPDKIRDIRRSLEETLMDDQWTKNTVYEIGS